MFSPPGILSSSNEKSSVLGSKPKNTGSVITGGVFALNKVWNFFYWFFIWILTDLQTCVLFLEKEKESVPNNLKDTLRPCVLVLHIFHVCKICRSSSLLLEEKRKQILSLAIKKLLTFY
jgi:hypothetical protein